MVKSQYHLLLQIMLIVLLLISIDKELNATHIIGGQMTYECVDTDLTDDLVHFEITFTLFEDLFAPTPTSFDYPKFGIYEEVEANTWTWISTHYSQNIHDIFQLQVDSYDPCAPMYTGVEGFSFVFDINLPVSDNNYMIVYQRCCRNNAINNILDPGDTGMAIAVEITPEAQMTCDNSPQFNELPPVFVCQGQAVEIDFSATDLDGDELQYSFCAPKTGGGNIGEGPNAILCSGVSPNPENCPPPYDNIPFLDPIGTLGGLTLETPIAGDPIITIDPNTGIISGTPTQIGQYVTGVCVQAFRDGQLIAEVVRDFTFTVGEISLSTKEDIKSFISLFPNPTKGLLTLELPSNVTGRVVARIVTGKIVVDQVIDNTDKLQIDFNGQDPGVYLVEVVTSESTVRYLDRVIVY